MNKHRMNRLLRSDIYVVDLEMKVKARVRVEAEDKEEAIDEAVAQFMENPEEHNARYEYVDADAVKELDT